MSVVAGIVHLGGGQIPARDLNTVLGAMGEWGPIAASIMFEGASFGRVGSDTHQPQTCLQGTAAITVAARLDNRDELIDQLGQGHSSHSMTDESLAIRAYERWGEACPERLSGDWSMAVWVASTRRLFLARDHFGNTALYFARSGDRIVFASDIKALRPLSWIPRRLNETRIASLLVGGGADDAHETVYLDISRLPPAHTVSFTPRETRVVRYWRVEDTPDSGPSSIAERAELLRETVRAAVRSRLGGDDPIGSMLSGGIDSAAVTAFAAEHVKSQGRRLTAFTAVPAFPIAGPRQGPGCPDEGPSAAAVVRAFDSIDHVLEPARTATPLRGIRRGLAIIGEPLIGAASYNWIPELMADAQARGITRLLTGSVGDFVMAGRPPVHSWRRDLSAGRYRPLLKRVTPNWLMRLRSVNWDPRRLAEPPWRPFSILSSGLAAETRLLERLRDAGRDPRDLKRIPGRAGIVRQATSHVGAIWSPLGAAFGLTVHDPLQDKRVMELMFSSPRPLTAHGTDRWLFRQSLIGVLPENVRVNRSKGMQAADIVSRLLASWPEVEEALSVSEASPLVRRCLDMPYCRVLAESIRSAPTSPYARRSAFTLVNGLATALFLAETWEQPTPAAG